MVVDLHVNIEPPLTPRRSPKGRPLCAHAQVWSVIIDLGSFLLLPWLCLGSARNHPVSVGIAPLLGTAAADSPEAGWCQSCPVGDGGGEGVGKLLSSFVFCFVMGGEAGEEVALWTTFFYIVFSKIPLSVFT